LRHENPHVDVGVLQQFSQAGQCRLSLGSYEADREGDVPPKPRFSAAEAGDQRLVSGRPDVPQQTAGGFRGAIVVAQLFEQGGNYARGKRICLT
jgi:hypothetical protein